MSGKSDGNGEIHGKYLSWDPECPGRVMEMEKSMENIHNLPKIILR